jgi:hypothetical protein
MVRPGCQLAEQRGGLPIGLQSLTCSELSEASN